jgi:hypothetical protein
VEVAAAGNSDDRIKAPRRTLISGQTFCHKMSTLLALNSAILS